MKKNIIIDIICFLLIFLFVYAGISKLADHANFHVQLGNMYLIHYAEPVLSYAIPILEILIALALVIPIFRLYGLYASLLLLILFTLYLICMITFKTALPCSCGGLIGYLSWKQHIFFNCFFIALTVYAIFFF
ncbi:MauE/DoxX family redox-associated membrane protein [Parafilimonas sp.]|uniref:MauE/DoxX family redox-associated membrane protein n=1 Tax=Parafilimonas sp. TaxID=1969739 RepID=UPI003F81DEC7